MANKYLFENRDQRIERMMRDNPRCSVEQCIVVVDGIWDKKRELILKNIPGRFKQADIGDLGYQTKEAISALNELLDDSSKNDVVGIVLCGVAGSGKTHAAYAMIKWLASKNPEMVAYMANYPYTIQELRTEFVNSTYDEMGSAWDKLNNESGLYNGVLLWDDISSGKQTDFEIDKLLAVLDRRMDNFMPFIITTNVKQEDFKSNFGERLASRLSGYCRVIEFEARDRRLDINNHGENEKGILSTE